MLRFFFFYYSCVIMRAQKGSVEAFTANFLFVFTGGS